MAKTASDLEVATRAEVTELVEYCRKLTVKDQDLADSMETSDSLIEAARYLEVYYKIDTYPYHDYIKTTIYLLLYCTIRFLYICTYNILRKRVSWNNTLFI